MNYIFIILISFLPILVWGYIFSYIDGDKINKKRFFIGIMSGAIGVLPIYFYSEIFDFLGLESFFYIFNQFNYLDFLLVIGLFIAIIFILSLLISLIFGNLKLNFKKMTQAIGLFIIFILISSLCLEIFNKLEILDFPIDSNTLGFSPIGISSFIMLLFYYLFVGIIEEFSKFSNYLGTSFSFTKTIQKGVLYAIFVSLGFVFLENIVYFLPNFSEEGFLSVYFVRSVFSLCFHLLCTSIIVYFFLKSVFKYRKNNFKYFAVFLLGIAISVVLHSSFDILLQLGYSFVLILAFIILYFFVTSIFYKD